MSLGQVTSATFLSCTPTSNTFTATATATSTVTSTFTTEYCFTAPAACPTAEWIATYTIQEICTGNPATWTQPSVPPNFIKTIVTCDACSQQTQTITCPVEQAAQTGQVMIHGNGVTATPAAAAATANTAPASGPSPGSGSGSSPAGAGANASSAAPSGAAAPAASSVAAAGTMSSMSPTVAMPNSNTDSEAASSTYVQSSALRLSLKTSMFVVSGLVALAAQQLTL